MSDLERQSQLTQEGVASDTADLIKDGLLTLIRSIALFLECKLRKIPDKNTKFDTL